MERSHSWFIAPVSKTGVVFTDHRGFESHSLRHSTINEPFQSLIFFML